MSALDDLIAGKGAPTAPVSNTSNLDALISGKPVIPTLSTAPTVAPVKSQVTPIAGSNIPASALSGSLGGGYGASNIPDQYSGKPLMTFENQKTQSSDLLKNRVAPTFDPTVPHKIDPSVLHNGRMPEAASQAVRKATGAEPDEQLDHLISLELGGSNDTSNLNPEKLKSDGTQLSLTLENNTARRVANGEISYIDGQKIIARAKGVRLPDDSEFAAADHPLVSAYPNPAPNQVVPQKGTSLFTKAGNALKSFFNRGKTTPQQDAKAFLERNTSGLASTAPVKVIAKMQGGEGILSALSDVYGDPLGARMSGNDIAAIVAKQQDFVKAGMDKQEATKQAVAAVKMQKSMAVMGRMGAGDTMPFETSLNLEPGGISTKITTPEIEQAWRTLGSPASEEEAISNYRSLAHSAHPDVPGGSTEAMVKLNKAFALIKENGLPGDMVYGPKAEIAPEEAMPEKPTAAPQETPVSKTPALDDLAKPENEKGLTAPSEKYMQAFNASNGQKVLAKIGGMEFALGDIGANHFDAKAAEGKNDRLSLQQLKDTLPHIKEAYNGSTDQANHRSNTAAWVATMPNGEQRVIYTKQNRFGQEEITSAHSVSKGEFVKTLKENGIPPGNRTQILPLEPASPNPLNERDTTTLAQGQEGVKGELLASKSRFKNAEDLITEIGRPKYGAQGLKINRAEAEQLIEHLSKADDELSKKERGIIYKPYGYESDRVSDVILGYTDIGRFGGGKIVAEIGRDGNLNGRIRIHGTPLDPKKVIARLGADEMGQLGSGKRPKPKVVEKVSPREKSDNSPATKDMATQPEISKVSKNLLRNNPDIGQKDAEAIARDVIVNRQFNEAKVDEPKPKPSESIVMASGFDPGLDKFITEDVKPAVRGAGEGFMKFLQEAKHLISPKAGASTKSLDLVFKMKGARDKAEAMLDLVTQKIEKSFDKMSEKDQIAFIDRVKRGEAQPTKELQAVADFIRSVDDETYREVQKYKPAAAWKENHYRVLWKVVPGSPETKGFKGLFRRPLQGSKGFLKHATLIDMSEGLAKGGIPYSYNPITMFKNAYADEMHFITAQRMWEAFKDNGLAKFVKTGGQRPDGFVRLNDTIAKVYFKADTEGGGNVLAQGGEWFVEENIGRVLNNFLSADKIRASALGRGMMAIKNATTAVELSLSAFHFTFETIEAASSKMALGIRESYNIGLLQKNPAMFFKGLKDIVTSFTSPKSTFTAGRRFLSMMRDAEGFKASPAGQKFLKQFPSAQDYIDDFFTGGGKLKMAKDYEINMQKAFMQNLASGNYIGATLRAVPAALKVMMTPLFDIYIPGLKMGMFMQEFPLRLQEKTNDLASGKVTRAQLARETVDFIENRLGEMNFDNLMWNRTFKTGLQFFFRSVTWKLGNIRAFGNNALLEQAKELQAAWREGRPPQISTGMAWVFSLAIYTALISTIAMKLLTGKYPTQLKDLVYPQSDPNDPTKRLSVPTYMRDGFSAANSPINYVLSSTSGEIGRMIDVWENKDFYGTEIYNQADPFYSKALAAALHLTPIPFSISSMVQPGPKTQKAIGFFGFTQAPAYITKDPLQQKISALYQTRFGGGTQTQQATDAAKAKTAIRNAYYAGDDTQANSLLQNAIKKGYITEKGAKTFVGDSDQPGDVRAFGRFDAPDQDMLLRDMTVDQLERYAWEAKPDVRDSLGDLSPNAKKFVALVKSGELKKPVWKRGEIQTTQ